MDINWTAVFVGAVTSVINGVVTFVSIHYVGKVVKMTDGQKKRDND